MKRLALVTAVILLCLASCYATVHTVSNLPFNPGQYNHPNPAIAAAANGDTIYIHGSTLSYGSMFVGRSLVIIGPGHHPDKQVPLPAMFSDIAVVAANVQLIGLTAEVISSNQASGVIRKCRITGRDFFNSVFITGNNWLIEGCLFDRWGSETSINFSNTAGHIVQHNLFASPGPKIAGINSLSGPPAQVINNVFLGDGFNFTAFNNFNTVIIRNNIFYGQGAFSNGQVGSMTNLTIDHNITYGASNMDFYPAGSFPINLINTDPLFSNPTSIGTPYVHTLDYDLQAGSPGQGYAQDGSRIGLFGGFAQFFTPIYTTTGEPSIAVVQIFNITSATTIPPGGTLSITVTSKRVP